MANTKISALTSGAPSTTSDEIVIARSGANYKLTLSQIVNDAASFGLNAPNLYKFRAALARQANGGAFVKLAFLGDSTTAGALSDATVANYRPNSFPKKFADMLTAAGIPACMTNAFAGPAGTQNYLQVPGLWDARLASTGGFSAGTSAFKWPGGLPFSNNNAAGTLSFTPGVSTDTVDIYYFDQTGAFTVDIDGGASLGTTTMGATLLFKKATYTYAAGSHQINITRSSGNWTIYGFDAYTAAVPQIHVWNWGGGGFKAADYANDTVTYDSIPCIKFCVPDLTVYSIGINDWLAGTSIASYTASVQATITAAQLSGSVILMTPFPTSTPAVGTQQTYVDAIRGLAITNNIPLIDENYNLVSMAMMSANSLSGDSNHPNGQGYWVVARDVLNKLEAVI